MTDLEKQILDHCKRVRAPFKTASTYGISVSEVWRLIDENPSYLENRPERFGGWGRPEIQEFVVARVSSGHEPWDNTSPPVAEARRLYEEGYVDMMTGRDGRWRLLYAFPRKKRQPRPGCWALGSL